MVPMSLHRLTKAALAAGVLTGLLAVPAAAAAAAPSTLPADQYTLTANYTQFDAVNSALVSTLGTAAVHTVMENANHDRTALPSRSPSPGSRRGSGSTAATTPTAPATRRASPPAATPWARRTAATTTGTSSSLSAGTPRTAATAASTRSRITLVDWDADYPNDYRKILLVEPTGTADAAELQGHPDPRRRHVLVRRLPLRRRHRARHARVRHAQDPEDEQRRHRRPDRPTRAAARTTPTTTPTSCRRSARSPRRRRRVRTLAWSSISLDRVSKSIVMTEYTCPSGCTDYPNRAPRAIRFPFASAGVFDVRHDDDGEPRRCSCPGTSSTVWPRTTAAGGSTPPVRKQLYYWKPIGRRRRPSRWVGGGESISYWEDDTSADLLWSLQEGAGQPQRLRGHPGHLRRWLSGPNRERARPGQLPGGPFRLPSRTPRGCGSATARLPILASWRPDDDSASS